MTLRPGGAAVLVVLALGPLCPAAAKDARDDEIPLPPIPPASLEPAEPPYQAKLNRLAELMGTLAYLRDLCGAGDGAAWRGRMDDLLKAGGTTAARRDRLAGSYNRGYAGYQLTYHSCTPAAEAVIARALSAGATVAADVSAKFTPP